MSRMRHLLSAAILLLAAAAPVSAQSGSEALVAEIREAYRDFDYDEAEAKGEVALRRYSDFTVAQLTEIHTVLGLVAYDQGDLGESRRQFISALQLTPDVQLDPLLISPKIIEFVESIRAERSLVGTTNPDAPPRYVILRDRRTDAALRSMLWPGWGQFYKGHTMKGWIISASFGAAAVGAFGAHLKRRDAKQAYESADPPFVQDRYHTFNRWHKARNALIQGAGLVWAVGYIDALLTGARVHPDQRLVSVRTSPSSVSVAIRF